MKQKIERAAPYAEMSVSEYVRTAVRERLERDRQQWLATRNQPQSIGQDDRSLPTN